MLGIVDYGMGNIFSILKATHLVGLKSELVNSPEKIKNYDCLILPGVGAFDKAIKKLKLDAIDEAIIDFHSTGKYVIGICLGMQLFLDESEEFGIHKGLGLIKGKCKKIPSIYNERKLNVPHISWNNINILNHSKPLFANISHNPFMYFIHSYHCDIHDKDLSLSTTNYSGFQFCSSYQKNNLIGMQFHPEKSSKNGLTILKNLNKII
jgi:imidazole glycerol-phosphate synthase subunit HisH